MNNLAILILLAMIGGIAVTLQAHFMGIMDEGIGTLESVFITYGSGGLIIGMAMLVARGGNLAAWQSVPWYALTAGILGLIIVGTIGYTTQRLGLVPALILVVASQFAVGAIMDHFGILGATVHPLTLTRMLGLSAILLGVWLLMR